MRLHNRLKSEVVSVAYELFAGGQLMDSDDFIRSGSQAEIDTDAGSPAPVGIGFQPNVAPKAEFSSVVSGLQFLFANSGSRIVTNRHHRVIWATSEAAVLASGDSCIHFTNGELAGRTRHSDALLRDMFDSAERAAPDAVEFLISTEPSCSPELYLRAQVYSAAGAPFTVFTIRNLAGQLRGIPNLRQLYGLTRSEQKIIDMMMQGKSVTEAAHALSKSVLTVRSHLKRAYGKLNVSSKEQLFSMIVKLMVN
jgi:DNA-binding CsgD family transcriptional regulator